MPVNACGRIADSHMRTATDWNHGRLVASAIASTSTSSAADAGEFHLVTAHATDAGDGRGRFVSILVDCRL